MRQPYKTDLTDNQWKDIGARIPPAKPGGRPRQVDLREILNTLLDQARTGAAATRMARYRGRLADAPAV